MVSITRQKHVLGLLFSIYESQKGAATLTRPGRDESSKSLYTFSFPGSSSSSTHQPERHISAELVGTCWYPTGTWLRSELFADIIPWSLILQHEKLRSKRRYVWSRIAFLYIISGHRLPGALAEKKKTHPCCNVCHIHKLPISSGLLYVWVLSVSGAFGP